MTTTQQPAPAQPDYDRRPDPGLDRLRREQQERRDRRESAARRPS